MCRNTGCNTVPLKVLFGTDSPELFCSFYSHCNLYDETLNNTVLIYSLCFPRVGCMCSLCWTTLLQEHRFSLECLLKPSALHGFMVRNKNRRKDRGKQKIHVFMVSKADALLGVWWEICWCKCDVPQCNIVLLDVRILQQEGLYPLIVLASSVSVHVLSRYKDVL